MDLQGELILPSPPAPLPEERGGVAPIRTNPQRSCRIENPFRGNPFHSFHS